MSNNIRPKIILLAAVGLCMWGCTGARILEPTGNLRDPLPAFTVQFHPNFVPNSFRATLDPGTPDEQDWTTRFTPTPQAGTSSSASVAEPFNGGTLLTAGSIIPTGGTITNYGRFRHTLKIQSDVGPSGIGFSLADQRDRVDFVPLHVVFAPRVIQFRQGSPSRTQLCLVPTPTSAVEVTVSVSPDSVALSLSAGGQQGQAIVVSVVPSGDEKQSCVPLEIAEQRGATITINRFYYVFGWCNGCQQGSASVQVLRRQ